MSGTEEYQGHSTITPLTGSPGFLVWQCPVKRGKGVW